MISVSYHAIKRYGQRHLDYNDNSIESLKENLKWQLIDLYLSADIQVNHPIKRGLLARVISDVVMIVKSRGNLVTIVTVLSYKEGNHTKWWYKEKVE